MITASWNRREKKGLIEHLTIAISFLTNKIPPIFHSKFVDCLYVNSPAYSFFICVSRTELFINALFIIFVLTFVCFHFELQSKSQNGLFFFTTHEHMHEQIEQIMYFSSIVLSLISPNNDFSVSILD